MSYDYETTDKAASEDAGKDSKAKGGKASKSYELARKWGRELAASKRWLDRFTRTAERCERAYLDDARDSVVATTDGSSSYDGKVNVFWANTQVVLSAIYGRLPKAEVDRKFADYDDDVSRVAGTIMQRILNGDIEREYDDTASVLRDAVADRFIVGLGQVWCRYEVETEEAEEPVLDENGQPPTEPVTDPMTGLPQVDPMTGQPAMRPVVDPATGQPPTQKVEKISNEEAE